MSTTQPSWIIAAAGLSGTLGACGMRDRPAAVETQGGAGGEQAGAGAPSEGGTAGTAMPEGGSENRAGQGGSAGADLPACPEDVSSDITFYAAGDEVITAACVSPRLIPPSDFAETRLVGLTVLEVADGDLSTCADGSTIPWNLPVPGRYIDAATRPSTAFTLDDGSGQTLVIEFALGSVPYDLVSPGDSVDLRYGGPNSPVNGSGYLALERGRRPVIFLAYGLAPRFEDMPVSIVRGRTLCYVGTCARPATVVSADGESLELVVDERAEVGGVVFQNDWFLDLNGCVASVTGTVMPYLVGGYTLP